MTSLITKKKNVKEYEEYEESHSGKEKQVENWKRKRQDVNDNEVLQKMKEFDMIFEDKEGKMETRVRVKNIN